MSRAARAVLVVLLVALAAAAGTIAWLVLRDDGSVPIPDASEVRVVAADPAVDLPYEVAVPAGDGCPAAAFRSPAEPILPPSAGYAAVVLDQQGGSAFLAVCVGAVEEVGHLEEVVTDVWSGGAAQDVDPELAGASRPLYVDRVTSALGESIAVTTRTGQHLVTDHYVERDGAVYVVGYLRREGYGDTERDVVDAMLASWQWR